MELGSFKIVLWGAEEKLELSWVIELLQKKGCLFLIFFLDLENLWGYHRSLQDWVHNTISQTQELFDDGFSLFLELLEIRICWLFFWFIRKLTEQGIQNFSLDSSPISLEVYGLNNLWQFLIRHQLFHLANHFLSVGHHLINKRILNDENLPDNLLPKELPILYSLGQSFEIPKSAILMLGFTMHASFLIAAKSILFAGLTFAESDRSMAWGTVDIGSVDRPHA